MAACYLGLGIYFRMRCGYNVVDSVGGGETIGSHKPGKEDVVADAECAPHA
jgi:hypothetical protein